MIVQQQQKNACDDHINDWIKKISIRIPLLERASEWITCELHVCGIITKKSF